MTVHTMTDAERIAYLEATIAKMKVSQQGKLTPKVGKAGGVSVYGLQRWPVTLYAEQWERLFAAREQIEAFIQANADALTRKAS